MKPFLYLMLLLISCGGENHSVQPYFVWEMKDGIAVIEVESVKKGGAKEGFWEHVADSITGFTGSSAFIWQGNGNLYKDPLVIDAPMTDFPYKLSYEIWVDHPGEYMIKIRNFHLREDGDNDAWISINRQKYQKIWDHDVNEFTWTEAIGWIKSYQPFELKKGINTIDIVGRSNGWTIDRLVIFKKDTPEELWSNLELEESKFVAPKKLDKNPPEQPFHVEAVYSGLSNVQLVWNASNDDHRIYGYEIFNHDELIGFTTDTIGYINLLEVGTEYIFTIRAIDFSGNKSSFSVPITVKTRDYDVNKDLIIGKTRLVPAIDGLEDEAWEAVKSYSFINSELEENLSANVKFMWDQNHLYVFLKVNGKSVSADKWQNGFRLFLDLDHNKTPFYSINDRIYYFSLSNPVIREVISRDEYVKDIQQAYLIGSNSYSVEFAIPWTTLGAKPTEGLLIGLDMVIEDLDQSENLKSNSLLVGSAGGISPFFLGSAKLVSEINF